MTHNLAIGLLLAPILVACNSPLKSTPQKPVYVVDYKVGSEVLLSSVAAEAAVKKQDELKEATRAPATSIDKRMRLLRAPMPRMPDEAIEAGLRDYVTVDILFNEAGDVDSVVPRSYKHPVLLEAVLAVARNWKIEPPIEAGRRVKTTVRQAFQFEVE